MDFIRKHQCQLVSDHGQLKFTISGSCIKESSSHLTPSCFRVMVERLIPAGGEAVVPGKVLDTEGRSGSGTGLVESSARSTHFSKLLVARSIVHIGNGTVPLGILNPTDRPRRVYKDTVAALGEQTEGKRDSIAAISPVEGSTVTEDPLSHSHSSDAVSSVPEHILDLFERSAEHLTDAAQADAVSSLLGQYADAFASLSDYLGRTGSEKHRINTGDATPIKQPARRVPIHTRSTVEEEVKKMLRESFSPLRILGHHQWC